MNNHNKAKTHCPKGHEYTKENTYYYPATSLRATHRSCRSCTQKKYSTYQRPPAYQVWSHIKSRCDNPKDKSYKDYGAKGITYISKWNTYEGFAEDMLVGYKQGLTIDRKDCYKNYEPSNCRWVTLSAQQNNKRNTRRFTINGITKTFKEWRDASIIKNSTINQRYYVYNWSIESSLGMEDR